MGAGAPRQSSLADIALLRLLAAGPSGLTRAGLSRDLHPLIAHRLSPAEWRESLNQILEAGVTGDAIEKRRARFRLTDRGRAVCVRFNGGPLPRGAGWPELRNSVLVAKALGAAPPRIGRRAGRLATAPGLRLAIIERSLHLDAGSLVDAAAARRAMASKALEPELSARRRGTLGVVEQRRLAARLIGARTSNSDAELVSLAAAGVVGSAQPDVAALRLALLRQFVVGVIRSKDSDQRRRQPPAPDLVTFARAILDDAAKVARGMPGNRKAFVSHVYGAIGATANRWGLDEVRFKALLAEAHRAGLIALTNADLRDRSTMADIQASAVTHQNTVWHLIRLEDA